MPVTDVFRVRVRSGLLALVLALTLAMPPTTASTQESMAEDATVLPGTYSFHSLDPFAAGEDLAHLDLTLSPDGSAQVELASADEDDEPFTADGRWVTSGDQVQLVLDHANGQPVAEPHAYTMRFEDGFPVGLAYAHGEAVEPFGALAFTLGSGDEHPLVPRLNEMLAGANHDDFRFPGEHVQRFGDYTRRSVARFQATHGLTPTGLVDLRTWRALQAAQAGDEPSEGEAMYSVARARAAQPAGQPVYVTFDDGPHPSWTPRMLDVLARYGAKATFFMVGREAENYPELVRQVVQAGHYVADHTWDHESLEGVSQAEFVEEVESTRDVLVSTASDLFTLDGDVNYVRPPYGATDASTQTYAADLGMSIVMWDVDPMDWRQPGAQQIATHVLENVYPGAIVLMHDGGGDRSQSVTALESILPGLAAQGYRFPTIFEGDPTAESIAPPPATTPGPAPAPAPAGRITWVVGGTDGAGANLRAQPSTEAAILAELPEGTPVVPLEGPIAAEGLLWRKVRAQGLDGWIVASYVRPS
jgi:peptidoglycan/xylan/chitin deacetylase (PgdA/CDA1 family)